jgi:hypothetical protein
MRTLAVAVVLVVSAVVAPAPVNATQETRGAQVGFWASQVLTPCESSVDPAFCPRDLSAYSPAVWQVLADTRAPLWIDLVYGSDFGPTPQNRPPRTDGLAIIRKANALGVPVHGWITAPLDGGTFANENNAVLMDQAVRALHRWTEQNRVTLGEFTYDLEFPLGYQAAVDVLSGDPARLRDVARTGIDPAHQCRAVARYRSTIAWAHAHGIRITGSPVSFALDDLADGRMALNDLLDIGPGLAAPFDALYVQAYRGFSQPGPGYVASYFKDMKRRFGDRGQVSLGNSGAAPYDNVANLVTDVQLLAGLGARTIPIFDFDGVAKTFGASGLRAVIDAGHQPLRGDALRAAATPAPYDRLNREFFRRVDVAASAATVAVTAAKARPRLPNRYIDGCR